MPNENQTLWCERVLRHETSIVHVFEIGATELPAWYSSSSAQLPLQSCVDSQGEPVSLWRDRASFRKRALVPKLRSPTKPPNLLGSETTLRLKERIDSRGGVETESFYSCLDSEEFCFNGGRSRPRGRIYRMAEEEFKEKELIPEV